MNALGAAWVAKRLKCDLPVVMEEIRGCADSAVDRANELLSTPRNDFPFTLEGDFRKFKVSGWPIGPNVDSSNFRTASFNMDTKAGRIVVKTVEGSPDFRVFQKWNVKEEKCSLYVEIEGEQTAEYTADQIAQLALERVLFV